VSSALQPARATAARTIDCDHSNCGETARGAQERIFSTPVNRRETLNFQRETYVSRL
jgi:hypothetical protein